jgi:hypothetical protein
MAQPLRILLQTTLTANNPDDWTISRFSLLRNYLTALQNDHGQPLCHITARDREPDAAGNDPILSQLSRDNFDQLWLFALDVGDGLSAQDQAGITQFYHQGGGILTTRDHQDMGISMCGLDPIGQFHYFHTQQCDPDGDRCCIDDPYTTYISWPNYHSGANGDYQAIQILEPIHPLLKHPDLPGGRLQYLPSHPHEGGVGVPDYAKSHASVIATGISKVTQRSFSLIVAAERIFSDSSETGRVVAQSTFHHFTDYNLDIDLGCPSFVDEAPGSGLKENPEALRQTYLYFQNLVKWLAPEA